MKKQINNYIDDLTKTLNNLDVNDIENCANILLEAYETGNNIFICGNGGSAATASHFACDINKGVSYGLEKRFKIIPLTDNLGTITAYSNDVGYDAVFVEQLKNFFNPGDVIELDNDIPMPRVTTNVYYDGRDKISSTHPITLTRAMYPDGGAGGTGPLMAGAVQALDTNRELLGMSAPY